jgi:hypothetical protein
MDSRRACGLLGGHRRLGASVAVVKPARRGTSPRVHRSAKINKIDAAWTELAALKNARAS